MVTDDILKEKIEILTAQKDEHAALMNQAIGAIALAQHLLTVKEPEPEVVSE